MTNYTTNANRHLAGSNTYGFAITDNASGDLVATGSFSMTEDSAGLNLSQKAEFLCQTFWNGQPINCVIYYEEEQMTRVVIEITRE